MSWLGMAWGEGCRSLERTASGNTAMAKNAATTSSCDGESRARAEEVPNQEIRLRPAR